jgi:hypothetical protein
LQLVIIDSVELRQHLDEHVLVESLVELARHRQEIAEGEVV